MWFINVLIHVHVYVYVHCTCMCMNCTWFIPCTCTHKCMSPYSTEITQYMYMYNAVSFLYYCSSTIVYYTTCILTVELLLLYVDILLTYKYIHVCSVCYIIHVHVHITQCTNVYNIILCCTQADLVACGVLSGNRNFEGRINPHTRANYLASPLLCLAYAIAGTVSIDFETQPLG